MNYESVYDAIETKLAALVSNAELHRPNVAAYKPTDLDIDIRVSENDVSIFTDKELKHDISFDLLLSVPVTTGTQRIHNIAGKIQSFFSPVESEKSGFIAGDYFVRINSVQQMPSDINDTRYQVNVRILATIYIKEI